MFSQAEHSRSILTVSKLNRLARSVLESEIGQVWLSAEISNFVAAGSGHWYFTLKDPRAQIRAAMFRNANRRVTLRPKEGDKVLVRANLSLYEPRGDYQLIVEHLEPEGEGLLKQQFEQLKVRLSAEGLFAQQNKQQLPANITRVGVVTSASGAALHDIITVLKRRNPAIRVILYPSQVQGEGAAEQICQAIDTANQRDEVDVLLVGRGGGSLEDLWCFNQESVARAIFQSRLPVVSAVGHEVDVSIADFVADVRAATPSAAAELVSQDQTELVQRMNHLIQRLHKACLASVKDHHFRLQQVQHRLAQNHPQYRLQQQSQLLDQWLMQLNAAMSRQLSQCSQSHSQLEFRLHQKSPLHQLQRLQSASDQWLHRLGQAMQGILNNKQQQLAGKAQLLDTVSPLATLARGYNIAYRQGEIVKSAKQLKTGDQVTSRFVDGDVISKVL